MKAHEYISLPFSNQIQWLYLDGEFVMDIRYYEFKISLYLIGDFYIEVFFHHKKDRIQKVQILDRNSSRMKFYMDQVKLKVA